MPGRSTLTVPDTLQGVLTARLDRLRDVREVVQLAAVLGRHFQLDLLQAIHPLPADELRAAVDRLVVEDVLQPIPASPTTRYEFRHALLHEAAYTSLPRRERQRHHLAVAEVLTTSFVDLAEREPEVVAHHFSEADAPGEAVAYWRAAGRQALQTAAFREAANHFRRALDALAAAPLAADSDRQRADLASSLAASMQAGLGYAADGVGELYDDARRLAERFDDHELLLSVIRGLQFFRLLRAEYAEALELAEEMSQIGRRLDDREATVDGYLQLGLTQLFRGELAVARTHFERAIDLYRPLDDERPTFSTLGDAGVGAMAYLATLLFRLGEIDESMRVSDDCVRLAEELGLPMSIAQAYGMRAMLHLSRREPVLMAEWAGRTVEHAEDRNITYWGLLCELLVAWSAARASGLAEDRAAYAETFARYLGAGNALGLPDLSMLLADLQLADGDRGAALRRARSRRAPRGGDR